MFFPRLFDRWMQNLRRCAGYKVQYFGAIEPQRRLAPHIHLAIRGAIPRATIRAVTKATYLQLWWPPFDEPVYTDEFPWWDQQAETYRCPDTWMPLPTWEKALDHLDEDPDAKPAVVMRFGTQVDIAGIIAPSPDADRASRYLTKHLTKDVADTDTAPDGVPVDPAQEEHIDRLHAQLQVLPCNPECFDWLRYVIQPKDAGPALGCPSKAHRRDHLGLGGRRVQISRAWSGKTLTEHRADRAAVVRAVLEEAGIEAPAADRMAADTLAADGPPPVRVGRTSPSPTATTSPSSCQPSGKPTAGAASTSGRSSRRRPVPGPTRRERGCGQPVRQPHAPLPPDNQPLAEGAPPHGVQQIVGHSAIDVTMNI